MSSVRSLIAAGGLAATSLVAAGVALAPAPASAAATCPNNNWSNIANTRVTNNFTTDGVNIRTGDGTACTSVGQGQRTHDTVLHCNNYNGSYNWNHLRDTTNDKSGWVRVDNLAVWTINAC